MEFSDQVVGVLLVVSLGLVIVLGVLVLALGRRLATLRRAYTLAVGPEAGGDLIEAVSRQRTDLEGLRRDLGIVHANTEHLRELARGAVSGVGMVRYDAFEDMGGALSFSAALLDEYGDGVVLSVINGRTETRTYGKPVFGGASEYNLSPEEVSAIREAMSGRRGRDGNEAARGPKAAS